MGGQNTNHVIAFGRENNAHVMAGPAQEPRLVGDFPTDRQKAGQPIAQMLVLHDVEHLIAGLGADQFALINFFQKVSHVARARHIVFIDVARGQLKALRA